MQTDFLSPNTHSQAMQSRPTFGKEYVCERTKKFDLGTIYLQT